MKTHMITVRIVQLLVISLLYSSVLFPSEPVPAPKQDHPIALVGGTIHTITGAVILNGIVLFDKGKIVAVGESVNLPDSTERVDVRGKHIYPGLVNAASTTGLQEIELVRATVDYSETGRINPNVRTEIAINPESELIPTNRANGITISHVIPRGSLISGMSSVIMMDGWTTDDLLLKSSAGLYVAWPSMRIGSRGRNRVSEDEQRKAIQKNIDELYTAFSDAQAYATSKKNNPNIPVDLRWESMIPVFERTVPVIIRADEITQIRAALQFVQKYNLRLILHGGRDAVHMLDLLKERKIPVILGNIFSLPRTRESGYDEPYSLPATLSAAGIEFAITGEGMESMGERNLPYQAGLAVSYGLDKDEAIRAITITPARILGIERRVGSIEVGKDATLIVTDGNPLDIRTNVEREYILGKNIDLRSRHTGLYQKYLERYKQLSNTK